MLGFQGRKIFNFIVRIELLISFRYNLRQGNECVDLLAKQDQEDCN